MSYPETPPNSLSGKKLHRHPSVGRIGIRLDGAERTDVVFYDMERGVIETNAGETLFGKVEAFWRWPESRQERRRRERWDVEHGAPA